VRVVAIACAYHEDPELLATAAEDSAAVTHAHPLGRAGAVAHAIAIGHVLRAGEGQSLDGERLVAEIVAAPAVRGTILASRIEEALRLARGGVSAGEAGRVLGNGVVAEEGVPLAVFSFLRWGPDFGGVVKNAVLAGGDTDTIAAMGGALCGGLVGEERIAAEWIGRAEAGARGIEYVRSLADAVFEIWADPCRNPLRAASLPTIRAPV